MDYKHPFSPVTDEPSSPNTLVSKITEHFKTLKFIEIVRKTQQSQKKVNQLDPKFTTEGHPSEDVPEIAECIMHAVLADAAEKGIATYFVNFCVDNKDGKGVIKRQYTINKRDVGLYLDSDTEEGNNPSSDATIQEVALDTIKEILGLSSEHFREEIGSQRELILNLVDRILETQRNQNVSVENLQQLIATLTEQIRDAAIQKDNALSIVYQTKLAEIEASAQAEKHKTFGSILRPAMMMLTMQFGEKFGISPEMLMSDEERKEAQKAKAEQQAKSEAEASGEDVSEEELKRRAEELEKRMETEPTVVYLETLDKSLSTEQWHQLYEIKPIALIHKIKKALGLTNEAEARAAVKDFAGTIMQSEELQNQIGEILTEQQQVIIKHLFFQVAQEST